jgi:hypothetical protein
MPDGRNTLTLFRPASWFSCGFPSRPTRSKPLQGAKCHRGDRLKRQRSTSGYQPLDKIKCKIGPKVPHDPRVLLHRGTAGQPWAKKEIEKPRPSPAGPRKSLYAVFSARETSLVHPLKVDSRMRESHTIVAVQLKPRMTILLKRKPTARSRAAPTEGRPSA